MSSQASPAQTTNTPANLITITFVDHNTEESVPYQLSPNFTIREIYELFDENHILESDTYYLAYNGKVLHKNWTLEASKISDGVTIDIFSRQFITVTFQGSNVTFNGLNQTGANISTDAFIGDIKETLSPLVNQKPQDIQIYLNNEELNEDSTLLGLGITCDTTMVVKFEERIIVEVRFLGISVKFTLSTASTLQNLFDMAMNTLNDVSVEKIIASIDGRTCSPSQTLEELGVQNLDKIDLDVVIRGGRL